MLQSKHSYQLIRGASAHGAHHGVFTQWQQKFFLLEALGAAYTPLSISQDGKIYSQNDGHLFVVGQ